MVTHVIVSVGWLGLTLCLLTLAIAGATSEASTTDEMAYRAMRTFSDWLLAPLALLTALSGLVLSLGTPWGLARHWWVWIKFVLTLALIAASLLALRGVIGHAADQVAAGAEVHAQDLVMGPAVSLTAYVFLTAISVLKPWGLTRHGQRKRDAELAARRAGRGTPERAA
ncbi:hypothetical protein AN216_22170 [Streptomyces oceani]|uniref:DUF2269 domain-containing protein n=1 Tax=Streptomyces oceani TaxID=1075402 RepID=A0A1E7JX17_9ACTN|nr:hypothetical protein AN216_22170 [Streptomyces oceani]